MLFIGLQCHALDIVYPKTTTVTINSPSTFFIGSSNLPITVNGADVPLGAKGAFAYSVPLNVGQNTFEIKSADAIKTFIITRPIPTSGSYTPPKVIDYPCAKNFFTNTDGVPLRETPIDAGINRMAHYQLNVPLTVTGESRDFYKVFLNNETSAWILKSHVSENTAEIAPAKLLDYKYTEDENYYTYSFYLNKKVPFTFSEDLTLRLFSVDDDTYIFKAPINQRLTGYRTYYEGNTFILKIRKAPKNNYKIVIDAGHGGAEYGAIGCCGDKEKDINLSIAKYLAEDLKCRKMDVTMTRSSDIAISLKDRIQIAEDKDALILVSVHANALPDSADPIKTRGTSVYYYYNQAKPLAESILTSMTTQLGTVNDNVRRGSLALVRTTACVSVLVEVAYIINPDDNALLSDPIFQKNCAKAIADGIANFIKLR